MTEERNFGDLVPQQRESQFEGEQVRVEDIVDQPIKIVKAKICTDPNGEWGDMEVLHDGKEKTVITGSGPLMDAIKTMQEKDLLKAGPINTTIRSKKSKTSRFSYYVFE